jgi:hypothetical protein
LDDIFLGRKEVESAMLKLWLPRIYYGIALEATHYLIVGVISRKITACMTLYMRLYIYRVPVTVLN